MARQGGFFEKLSTKIERLAPESIQAHFQTMAKERGFLETVFNSINEGVMVVSGSGTLQYSNHAAGMFFGFDTDKFNGRDVSAYLPELDWARLASGSQDSGWDTLFSGEIEVAQPAHRILAYSASPLESRGQDDPPASILILRDVTAEREQVATAMESERMQAIRALASSVAHEIGNPLNSIGIHVQLMRRMVPSLPDDCREDFAEMLSVASDEIARLNLIITQFLGAMRPSPPEFARGDIAATLKETLTAMRAEIENRKIAVALINSEKLPDVFFDAGQMKQVFFNILKNALQAMPDGGSISIEFAADDRNLAIGLRDTGTGIGHDDFKRVFEPYRTTKAHGNGIGLLIVQRIVQDHGGEIEISSKKGEGTVFKVRLPLADRRIRLLTSNNASAAKQR